MSSPLVRLGKFDFREVLHPTVIDILASLFGIVMIGGVALEYGSLVALVQNNLFVFVMLTLLSAALSVSLGFARGRQFSFWMWVNVCWLTAGFVVVAYFGYVAWSFSNFYK